jgi:CubicO group peptidase (beta-lactamase class C family)
MKRLCLAIVALLAGAIAGCNSDAKTHAPDVAVDAGDGRFDFSEAHAYLFEGSWKTEGVVVLYDGKRVYEEYASGYGPEHRHIGYSVSKSVGSTLVGIAVGEGLLSIDDSVCKYFPAPAGADPTFCDTTVRHVLNMSSGLKWVEDYGDAPQTSDVLPMLYGVEPDMGAFVARHPRVAPPGTTFVYSSGDANLLARVLRGALGGKDMRAWAQEKLFGPAGMTSAVFETDRSGTLVFSSGCFMTPRDMARYGELYRGRGTLDGARVVPEDWVNASLTPAPAVAQPAPRVAGRAPGDSGGSYGFQWWLNAASPAAPVDTFAYPEVPAEGFYAAGHWGQGIVVIPSRKVVIVRVGNDRDAIFDRGPLAEKVLSALAKGGAT